MKDDQPQIWTRGEEHESMCVIMHGSQRVATVHSNGAGIILPGTEDHVDLILNAPQTAHELKTLKANLNKLLEEATLKERERCLALTLQIQDADSPESKYWSLMKLYAEIKRG